jgi:hypothetical protein
VRRHSGDEDTGGNSEGRGTDNNQQSTKSNGSNRDGNGDDGSKKYYNENKDKGGGSGGGSPAVVAAVRQRQRQRQQQRQQQRSSSAVAMAVAAAASRQRQQHGGKGSSRAGGSAAAVGDFSFCLHAHNRLFVMVLLYFTEFLARNGQIWQAKLPPTAFSDQIHSDSMKIKTKRKRMMGWIKIGPKNLSWFFIRQHLPAKTNFFPFRFISLIFSSTAPWTFHLWVWSSVDGIWAELGNLCTLRG